MRQVLENRQNGTAWVSLPDNVPRTDGYIAVLDCDELGNIWWVQNPQGQWESMLVVDCACPGDGTTEWMIENNVALEIDYQTALRWDRVGQGFMTYWSKQNPIGKMLHP